MATLYEGVGKKTGMERDVYIQVLRCSAHDVWALSVGDEDTSIRVTNRKCCGSWDETHAMFLATKSVAIQLVAALQSFGVLEKRRLAMNHKEVAAEILERHENSGCWGLMEQGDALETITAILQAAYIGS